MTITNSRSVFISWLCKHTSVRLLVQMQPEDTYMRIIQNPQNKQVERIQQYLPTWKIIAAPPYPVWRTPMKLAWVMMNLKQNSRQSFPRSKHPDCPALVFVPPYTERLKRREKTTPPLGVKAHPARYLFPLLVTNSGNLTDTWLILKFSKIPSLQSADHSSSYFFYIQEDLTLLNLVPSLMLLI